jgi:hypothetical protein
LAGPAPFITGTSDLISAGDIDPGIASQIGLVLALEVLMAGIDVPAFSFLVGLDIALFAIIGFGVALAFHGSSPPLPVCGERFATASRRG